MSSGDQATWFDDDLEDLEAVASLEHVLLRLGAGRYAVAAEHVVEVVPVPPLTRVPAAPGWLVGVGNWRGHVLPVADLRQLLGIDATPLASSGRVVVLRGDEVEVGVVADQVLGLLEVPVDHDPAPLTLAAEASDLVVGLSDDGAATGPVAILDAGAVLGLARSRPSRPR
ncbi:MAG: chemotaxis protein CheW [Candidatus Nanopelagicales bacterium]